VVSRIKGDGSRRRRESWDPNVWVSKGNDADGLVPPEGNQGGGSVRTWIKEGRLDVPDLNGGSPYSQNGQDDVTVVEKEAVTPKQSRQNLSDPR
jgi:hypothetical protein